MVLYPFAGKRLYEAVRGLKIDVLIFEGIAASNVPISTHFRIQPRKNLIADMYFRTEMSKSKRLPQC
jgi:hypothetical protein